MAQLRVGEGYLAWASVAFMHDPNVRCSDFDSYAPGDDQDLAGTSSD